MCSRWPCLSREVGPPSVSSSLNHSVKQAQLEPFHGPWKRPRSSLSLHIQYMSQGYQDGVGSILRMGIMKVHCWSSESACVCMLEQRGDLGLWKNSRQHGNYFSFCFPVQPCAAWFCAEPWGQILMFGCWGFLKAKEKFLLKCQRYFESSVVPYLGPWDGFTLS